MGKWVRYTPVSVLRLVVSMFPKDADGVLTKYWSGRNGPALSSWERMLLASELARNIQNDMGEAARLCDRVAVVSNGRIIVCATPDALITGSHAGTLEEVILQLTAES